MWRTALGGLVVAHGLLTAAIWLPKYKEVEGTTIQPANPSHSWLVGDARGVALALALTAALLLVVAGAAFLSHQTWWPTAGLTAGAVSLLLFVLFFSPLVGHRTRHQRWARHRRAARWLTSLISP